MTRITTVLFLSIALSGFVLTVQAAPADTEVACPQAMPMDAGCITGCAAAVACPALELSMALRLSEQLPAQAPSLLVYPTRAPDTAPPKLLSA